METNRKFRIARMCVALLAGAYLLSFVLAYQGKTPLMDGMHVVSGIGLIVGLYGVQNIINKRVANPVGEGSSNAQT